MAAARVHQHRTAFTFRSVLRIQMKVQTLGLLGHFSTMNPPGPFSPLQASGSTQSGPGLLCNTLGCTALQQQPPLHAWQQELKPSRVRADAECPGRDLLWLQHTRGRFPTGALAQKQPLPPGCASPASALPPREVPRCNPYGRGCKEEGPGEPSGQGNPAWAGTGSALSPQPPAPSSHHLIRLRDESCSPHTEPKYRFPFPVQEHAIFCCIHLYRRSF